MITNKLAYFKTQSEFNALRNAGQIDSTTICFIEENRVIYTHGVEFTGARMLQYLEDIMDGLREEVKAADEALRDFIKSIEGRLNEEYERNKEEFNKAIEDARKAIEDARRALEQLEQDKADAWVEINKLQGSIKQQSEYYDKLEGRVTTMYQEMNAKNGTFEQFMQNVNTTLNTINGTITEFYSKIDVINGRFDEYLKKTDLDTEVVSIIGREADAENGTLKDFVKKTGPDGVMKYVEDYMNSTDPSFAEIAAVVDAMATRLTGVCAFFDDAKQLFGSSIFASYQSAVDENKKAIAALQAFVGEDGEYAGFDLMAALADGDVQARIWGIVKDNKSQLGLTADDIGLDASNIIIDADNILNLAAKIQTLISGGDVTIELTEDQIKMIADQVTIESGTGAAASLKVGTAPNDITITESKGIIHNSTGSSHGFVFNTDGSGSVANGRISWDENGKITITTDSNDDLSLYGYSKITTTDITNQISSHYEDVIQAWVEQQIAAAQLGGEIGEEELQQLVQDYIDGEFKAELKQEYTPAINQSAAVVAKMYPSGTIFRDGKAYYPDYPTEATPKWELDIQTATAGMLTSTWWDTEKQSLVASASLQASVEDIMENVTKTAVIEALADKLSSKVNISADQVNISGESITLSSKLTEIEGNMVVKGAVTANMLETQSTAGGGNTKYNTTIAKNLTISKVIGSMTTHLFEINSDATGDQAFIVGFANGAGDENAQLKINADGSGQLAHGYLKWDTSGSLSTSAKIYSNQSGIVGSKQGSKYLDIENGTLTQYNNNLGNTVAVTIDNGLEVSVNGSTLIEANSINGATVKNLLSNSAKFEDDNSVLTIEPDFIDLQPALISDNKSITINRTSGITVGGKKGISGYFSVGTGAYLCYINGICIGFATSQENAERHLGDYATNLMPLG